MIKDLSKFTHRSRVMKRWRDHDEYRHVNNSVYLTYMEEARISYFHEAYEWDWKRVGIILARVEIDFLKELKLLDPTWIYTRIVRVGTKSFKLEYVWVNEFEDRMEEVTRATSTMVMFDYEQKTTFPISDKIREQFLNYEKPDTIEV